MAERVFFHLGAHKTATTYMQKLFRANKKYFASRDTTLVFKRTLSKHGLGQFFGWRKRIEKNPKAKRPKKLEGYLIELASSEKKNVFISYEGLLGRMELSRSRTIYPAAEQSIGLLKSAFSEKNIKVVFCVRGYADFIESTYNWLVKNGSGKSFDQYVNAIAVDELSWKPVVNALREGFGDENVLFWKYEDYKDNYKDINSRLLDFFYDGAAGGELKYEENSAKNVSFGRKYMKLMVSLNRLIDRTAGISSRRKRKIKKIAGKVLGRIQSQGGRRVKPQLLSHDVRQMLDERYRADIDELIGDGARFIRG